MAATTAPAIFSHLALDFLAVGDFVTFPTACFALLVWAAVSFRRLSCSRRGGGAVCCFFSSLANSFMNSKNSATGQTPRANSATINTQEPQSLSLFFCWLPAMGQSPFFFSFFLLPFSSIT